jgi:ketosteroid isomerase-like protein
MTAPLCRKCGAALRPYKPMYWIRTEEQAKRGIGGGDWITVPQLPQTKEEAQRLTNHKITKVYWASDGMSASGINGFMAWDGESYERRYRHFCTVRCAAEFGMIIADGEL